MDTQQQIDKVTKQLEDLRRLFFEDNFSNLKVFNKPVQLNKGLVIGTADTTAAGAYAGRIAITVGGVTKYLHYYDA